MMLSYYKNCEIAGKAPLYLWTLWRYKMLLLLLLLLLLLKCQNCAKTALRKIAIFWWV